MTDNPKGQVAAYLKKSGFPLEMRVAGEWEKAGFDVSQGVYYLDPETATARETDIVATKENLTNHAWLRFFAVVECKSSREPWVLFPRRGPPLKPRPRIQAISVGPLTGPYLSRISSRSDIAGLAVFMSEQRPAYGMVQARSDKPDQAYSALMSVSKSAAALLQELMSSSEVEESLELVWPMIITEAPLFEAELSTSGDLNIEPIKRGTLMWRHPTAGRGIRAIDVVHADAVASFISEVKQAVDLIFYNTEVEASRSMAKRRELKVKAQTLST